MKTYEMKLNRDIDGLRAVSLVKKPAIESDFVKLSAQQEVKLSINEEKMEVTGAVLIPDQRIYRTDGKEEWYIYFSKETIKDLSIALLSSENVNKVTIEHNESTDAVQLVESWIVENSEIDKSVALGLEPLPVGTLVQTRKINDVELWEDIKSGKYNGYSIEALMTPELVEMNEQEQLLKKVINIINS